MTVQKKMEAILQKAGIPSKEIKVFGSQIMITTKGEASARKWAALLSKFATVRGVIESRDDNLVNNGTSLRPSSHKVWRVGAYI